MSNVAKTSDLLLLDEINEKHGNIFSRLDLVFDDPAPSTQHSRNTKVRIHSAPSSQYVGFQDVWYNRLDIGELFQRFGQTEVELPRNGATTYADVLNTLNTVYGLAITADELVETPIVGNRITLTLTDKSFAFTGSLNVILASVRVPIDTVMTVQVLDGLWYPDAVIDHLITPLSMEGVLLGDAVDGSGKLLNGEEAGFMLISTNNELETALRANPVSGPLADPSGPTYTLNLANAAQWNLVFSLNLLNTVAGEYIDELYDVRLYLRALSLNQEIEFQLSRDIEQRYVLRDTQRNITLSDLTVSPDNTVLQGVMRFADHAVYLAGLVGSGAGSYDIGLMAYRRNSIVPRVASIAKVVVTETAT